ncbi:S8 family serine peptidase [Actinoplanes lobatus]|uniref:Subtilisin family serine protease/alpha-tubulin suppressor-like RCC1 family protein n=1 Tax=Actinoplanes lobatus TaxID=113568 RepID=A0A7W7HP17_9ACTN|nr:S8 family serine peptidase [Actinoplanes lobatus]MBB4754059.1 subtilisin family serine protease/alpha-tubulin suppressor-like RCC1 family protein [Actinoplanes lobatus]
MAVTLLGTAAAPAAAAFASAQDAGGTASGRYIVMLRRDRVFAQGVSGAARALAGGRVDRVFGAGTPGFTASLSASQARRLAADPSVAVVERDRRVRLSATQRKAPWSLDRIDARSSKLSGTYTPSSGGAGVRAYVIDTGIRTSHREFGGRASSGYDFVDDDANAADCAGHGTHVAGSIGGARYGVAKSARLVSVRVLDCEGSGWNSDVVAGIDWVTENAIHPAVANMSLGGSYSAAIDTAVKNSIDSGITYVVAAGNEDENACYGSPSGLKPAITVAATDYRDRRASFSDYGSCVDIFAPGVDITSAGVYSNTATATKSGTSMASPHVAGAAALLLAANPGLSPGAVRDALVRQATTGKVRDTVGSPNRLLYVPAPPKKAVIATKTLPSAATGRPYRAQLKLTAGRRGSWKLASGTLPAGLRLSASGLISGTPTAVGSRRFTVRFTDYVPQHTDRQIALTVVDGPPVIATRSLPTAELDTAYRAQLATSDKRAGTWSVAAGTLPTGLSLSTAGLITGTATEAGTITITVRFTDTKRRTATANLTLKVEGLDPGPEPGPSVQFVQVTAGMNHTCALDSDAKAYCWGWGGNGQLGNADADPAYQLTPVAVAAPAGVGFTRLTAGWSHTCGLSSDSKAYCWGYNFHGQLGTGDTADRPAPVPVTAPAGVSFIQLTAGYNHTCGLSSDSKAYCWGGGYAGQLGNGDTDTVMQLTPVPVTAPDGVGFAQLTAGTTHTCGLGNDSKAYCWGDNFHGQLGTGETGHTGDRATPVPVTAPAGVSFTQLTADNDHTCGLGSDTTTYCWGDGSNGRLGNGDTADQATPVPITAPPGVSFTQLTAIYSHTCGLGSDSKAYCWGSGSSGQLGNGDTADRATPVPIAAPAGVSFTQLTAGHFHTCGLGSDTKTYCWGEGPLGNGDTTNESTPVAVKLPPLVDPVGP